MAKRPNMPNKAQSPAPIRTFNHMIARIEPGNVTGVRDQPLQQAPSEKKRPAALTPPQRPAPPPPAQTHRARIEAAAREGMADFEDATGISVSDNFSAPASAKRPKVAKPPEYLSRAESRRLKSIGYFRNDDD